MRGGAEGMSAEGSESDESEDDDDGDEADESDESIVTGLGIEKRSWISSSERSLSVRFERLGSPLRGEGDNEKGDTPRLTSMSEIGCRLSKVVIEVEVKDTKERR